MCAGVLVYVYIYVCVCVCEREREGERWIQRGEMPDWNVIKEPIISNNSRDILTTLNPRKAYIMIQLPVGASL